MRSTYTPAGTTLVELALARDQTFQQVSSAQTTKHSEMACVYGQM